MGCNRVFDWVLPGQLGHTKFFLTLFFLQPNSVPAPGQSSRVSKLWSKIWQLKRHGMVTNLLPINSRFLVSLFPYIKFRNGKNLMIKV